MVLSTTPRSPPPVLLCVRVNPTTVFCLIYHLFLCFRCGLHGDVGMCRVCNNPFYGAHLADETHHPGFFSVDETTRT